MNSDAEIEKNGTAASPATARASSVLPVPGMPESRTPLGTRRAQARVAPGLRRKSTTSTSSSSASSMPATSSKDTRLAVASGSYRCARDRPNDPSPPDADMRWTGARSG